MRSATTRLATNMPIKSHFEKNSSSSAIPPAFASTFKRNTRNTTDGLGCPFYDHQVVLALQIPLHYGSRQTARTHPARIHPDALPKNVRTTYKQKALVFSTSGTSFSPTTSAIAFDRLLSSPQPWTFQHWRLGWTSTRKHTTSLEKLTGSSNHRVHATDVFPQLLLLTADVRVVLLLRGTGLVFFPVIFQRQSGVSKGGRSKEAESPLSENSDSSASCPLPWL